MCTCTINKFIFCAFYLGILFVIIYTNTFAKEMDAVTMKLSSRLAQSIVDNTMKQIPYNVNIMDENGYIIASGDKNRINTLHVGAVEAIKRRKTLPMTDEVGSYGQPGINMPLIFDGKVVGVIGITGKPQTVTPLASLLKMTAELLLEQAEQNKNEVKYENSLNSFLYQWSQVTDDINKNTELLLEADNLKIDISKPRNAIAIQCPPEVIKQFRIDSADLSLPITANTVLIFTYLPSTITRSIELCKKKEFNIGIGEATTSIGISVNQALRTLELSKIFINENYIYYKDIKFIDSILNSNIYSDKIISNFRQLENSDTGKELIETIYQYIKNDGNVVKTSNVLHIHRNSLNHRLLRIHEIFNLDPRKTVDLFKLYLGYIYFTYYSYKS